MSNKKTSSSKRPKSASGIRVVEDTPTTPQALTIEPEAAPAPAGATGRLAEIKAAWIDHLRTSGTSESTCLSYQNDLAVAEKHFGSMDNPGWWTTDDVAKFEASDGVITTKSGRPKAMPTVLKTRRVLRLAVAWAFATGLIASSPYAVASKS